MVGDIMNYRHIILAALIVLALIVVPCSATIYVHNNSWSLVAAQSGSQTYILSLTQYDDGTGNAIYGGTFPNGQLLKYNRTLGAWSLVAAQSGSQAYIRSLTQYDDGTGNAIYGGTYPNGQLLKYNRTLGAWSLVAAQSGSQSYIYSLTQYDDGTGNAIYGGTRPNGTLLRWGTYTDLLNASFHTAVSYTNPITLSFTDNSTGLPAAWNWSLAGNVSDIRNVSSPFDYGTYLINLTVNRGDLYSTSLRTIALPLSQISPAGPLTIWSPPGLAFQDTSTGTPTTWDWNWGDGTHCYTASCYKQWYGPGTYNVSLNASTATAYSVNYTTVVVLKGWWG